MHFLATATAGQWAPLNSDPNDDAIQQDSAHTNAALLSAQISHLLTSRNLIVLTGLGTSLCATRNGNRAFPTMRELWDEAFGAYGAELESAIAACKRTALDFGCNIEKLLSTLTAVQKLALVGRRSRVHKAIRNIEDLIVTRCSAAADNVTTHEMLLRKIVRRSVRLPRPRLFTTNYDCCFEFAASNLRFVTIDGFSYDAPQVFDGSYFDYDIVKRDQTDQSSDFISNVFHLYKLHGSVTWSRSDNKVMRMRRPEQPLLIFPRDSKFESSYEQPFLELMSRFQSSLRLPNAGLLIIGFGFNDHHLNQPLMTAIRSNVSMRVLVVDPVLNTTDNSCIGELRTLITSGDSRLSLVAGKFEEFVPLIPDLVADTESEQHLRRVSAAKEQRP